MTDKAVELGNSQDTESGFIRVREEDWIKLNQQREDDSLFREKLLECLGDISESLRFIADNLPD